MIPCIFVVSIVISTLSLQIVFIQVLSPFFFFIFFFHLPSLDSAIPWWRWTLSFSLAWVLVSRTAVIVHSAVFVLSSFRYLMMCRYMSVCPKKVDLDKHLDGGWLETRLSGSSFWSNHIGFFEGNTGYGHFCLLLLYWSLGRWLQ